MLYTVTNVVSDINIAIFHKVQEGLEVEKHFEVFFIVWSRLDDDFLALVHGSVNVVITSLNAGELSGARPVLIKHILDSLVVNGVGQELDVKATGDNGFIYQVIDKLELFIRHHRDLNVRIHIRLNERGSVTH